MARRRSARFGFQCWCVFRVALPRRLLEAGLGLSVGSTKEVPAVNTDLHTRPVPAFCFCTLCCYCAVPCCAVLCAVQLTFTKPHILLLDEPSNHLDIDAVDALIQGLAMFKGGVLMVSVSQTRCGCCTE